MRRTLAVLSLAVAAIAAGPSLADDPEPDDPPMVHVDAPPMRVDSGAAVVVVGDDGGLHFQEARAIRGLAVGQLRKRGVQVIDAGADAVFNAEQLQGLMRELHLGRAFSVQVQGRLGSKVPLELDEIAFDRSVPIFSASLTAGSIEEADVVVPRLVNAVLDRLQPEDNAQLATVTREESRPFRKRPGEFHIAAGLVIPTFSGGDSSGSPYGLSLQLFYELEHFNFGIEGLFAHNRGLTAGGLFFQGNWLPIDGEISPYLGAGLGYMGADSNGGLGLKLQIGIEALRLHQVRILGGFEALIPLFSTNTDAFTGESTGSSSRSILPMFFLQFSL